VLQVPNIFNTLNTDPSKLAPQIKALQLDKVSKGELTVFENDLIVLGVARLFEHMAKYKEKTK
jgi:hypothetical protein